MFTKLIIDSDAFLDMPLSTQALYFHLSMRADDEGFINNPRKIMRMIGCNEDEMKVLLAKRFIIGFESGVIVIKHWKMHNCIRKDRLKETVYKEEKSQLFEKDNGAYSLNSGIPIDSQLSTKLQPTVNQVATNCQPIVSIGKVRLGKDRLGKDSNTYSPAEAEHNHIYKDIIDYFNERMNTNYKSTTNKNRELIKARINEGYDIDDFKTVIDNKILDWKGSDMEKYLRPMTLFGTKFDGYLNTKVTKRTQEGHIIDASEVIPF